MIIHAGAILEAIFWQLFGVGMLTKHGIDKHKQNLSERQKRLYFKPMTDWWRKYGVYGHEAFDFDTDIALLNEDGEKTRLNLKETILTAGIEPKDRAMKNLLKYIKANNGWLLKEPYKIQAKILYFALKGKAYDWNKSYDLTKYPSGSYFNQQPESFTQTIREILEAKGIPDLHWFLESVDRREKRLDEIWNSKN